MPKQTNIFASSMRAVALAALACGGLAVSSAPAWAQDSVAAGASQAAPVLDAAVLNRLKEVGLYLRSLKTFKLRADASTDEVLGTGQKVQFGSQVEYQVGGASQLRVSVRSDRRHRDYYFDGKTLTQAAPRAGYYASVPMEGTIGHMMTAVAERYEIEVPLADLFLWGTPAGGLEDVTAATLIGPAKISGLDADHFALRQDGVDWQVWIQKGDKPLPLKMVITTTDEAAQPQYSATLHWDLKAKPAAQTFTYAPAKGMHRIELKPASAVAVANNAPAN